jgi:hypothetical protein
MDPKISKYMYECSVDKMSVKQRARVRAKSWSQFLNETKNSNNESIKSNNSKFVFVQNKI